MLNEGAWPVAEMCSALKVTRQGYCAWRRRPPSARDGRDAGLSAKVSETYAASRGVYGAPKVFAELRRAGVRTSRARSTLVVFLADVALVLVTGLVPSGGAGVLERVLALFPINFSNFSVPFSALESYPLGPVVLDLIGMVLLVYGVFALVSTPMAAVSFRRHRVA